MQSILDSFPGKRVQFEVLICRQIVGRRLFLIVFCHFTGPLCISLRSYIFSHIRNADKFEIHILVDIERAGVDMSYFCQNYTYRICIVFALIKVQSNKIKINLNQFRGFVKPNFPGLFPGPFPERDFFHYHTCGHCFNNESFSKDIQRQFSAL